MTKENKFPDIVFIGQPNCGKSTLFNAIAGLKAQTSNFPGTTVKHSHSKVNIEGKVLNIIDLPGTYSLNPSDPAEKVVLTHLFLEKPDLIFNVVDASILGRSLELTLELIELEYPVIVVLNMIDLAEKKGVEIDLEKLEKLLGVPVIPTVASHGLGIKELLDASLRYMEKGLSVSHIKWSRDVEEKIEEMEDHLPEDFPITSNKRFTAINMISSSKLFFDKILKDVNPSLKIILDRVRRELETRHSAPAYEVIAAERHHLAFKISEESSRVVRGKKISMLDRVDDVIMHPFLGYLILLAVFLGFFLMSEVR
ncbi:Fe(2+) transporter FeoB [subsurface metagenome]